MPAVEDFPPVVQREWHAKQSAPPQQADVRQKSSLLSRITGLGKRPADPQPALPSDQNVTSDQDVPMPVQFGRERR
jgi:cell division protein FtsZ